MITLLIGLLGGAVSFMIVILAEGALASFYPDFLFKSSPYYWLFLLIPAVVEEGSKIGVAKKLMAFFSAPGIVVGLGLGFGIIESAVVTAPLGPALFLNPLAWVHLIFLGGGYLVAKISAQKNSLLFSWIAVSVILHWAYDVLVFTLSH